MTHAVTLFVVIWWKRGIDAFSSVGPWIVVVGAGIALGVEAGIRSRDTRADRRLFDTVIGIGLLMLVVFAAFRAEGGFLPFVSAALIGLGVGLRVLANQAEAGDNAPPLLRLGSELGLAAVAGGFALLADHLYALVGWAALVAVVVVQRISQRAPDPSASTSSADPP